MTPATSQPVTPDSSFAPDDTSARRARGLALIAGAVVVVALVETGTVPYYWFPTLTGLTYLGLGGVLAALLEQQAVQPIASSRR